NLGNVLRQRGDLDQAHTILEHALRLRPGFAAAQANLGYVFKDRGMMAHAEAHLQQALRLQPSPRLQVALATLLPPSYESTADAREWRVRFTREVNRLNAAGVQLDPDTESPIPAFFLAYQGKNDRDLQRSLARLHTPGPAAGMAASAVARAEKIR